MMRHPPSWRRALLWMSGLLLAAQSLVIATLAAASALRKRRTSPTSFPHERRLIAEVDGNEVRIYSYGQDLYSAMLAAIDDARETIFLETFIWKGDPLGEMFKQRLERKAAEGIHVFVIFDSFANLVVSPKFKRFSHAINVLEYRTLDRVWYLLDPRRYARDHRKLLVVDNEIAFIGGFNIGKLYATQWRDTHLRVRGPAARDLAHAFIDFWNNNRDWRAELPPVPSRAWPGQIKVHRNDPARLVLPIRGMYLEAIDRAQHHIYLTNAYFIPDRVILSALIQAAQRGVDVRVLLPWQSNHPTADWLARGFFSTCLRSGVRIFGFRNAMIHAKTATIDGLWSTVGTANLDRLSLAGNYEINIEIYDAGFAAEMEHIFDVDLSNAFELTLERWRHRPWLVWASEKLLSPLRPLL
ncbi:MAG TPA: phospholipase D-like domain-containing protein [Roseiflexaceae bacterium]|nr:phospholipase D-like domain-containing protein [Roseiflexaceae bacterium]